MLAERDLVVSNETVSVDFFCALQNRTFYMLREIYQRKLIPSSIYLPFWNKDIILNFGWSNGEQHKRRFSKCVHIMPIHPHVLAM